MYSSFFQFYGLDEAKICDKINIKKKDFFCVNQVVIQKNIPLPHTSIVIVLVVKIIMKKKGF